VTETHLIIALYVLTAARLLVYFKPSLIPTPLPRRNFNEFVDSIVQAGVSALLLIHFIVRSYYIPSESMLPTLLVQDYILVNELQYRFASPARGDVAVFHPPDTYKGDKEDLIKRVVGIEGDLIEIRNGTLYRNDQAVNEPFTLEKGMGDVKPTRVPPGHIFMMGDNRNNSYDSRFWGTVPVQNFVGKAELIFWPPPRIGRIR
jgi:signal peptidase I